MTRPTDSVAGPSGLAPGDILSNPLPGTSGHIVLFAGWTDAANTRHSSQKWSPSGGAQLNEIPYQDRWRIALEPAAGV